MVARHALGPHRPEVPVQPAPELLQAHAPTLARPPRPLGRPGWPGPGGSGPVRAGTGGRALTGYRGRVIPGTGSDALDLVLQIAIALATVVLIVLLVRNYRGR